MSNWTHVAAIIRIDDLRIFDTKLNFEELIGKSLSFDDIWEGTENYSQFKKDPKGYLPLGSEGSLKMSVWTNPDKSHCAAYTVSIFGDLRDHEDPSEIIRWFKDLILSHKFITRQAVITAENEMNGHETWTYIEEG